MRITSSLIYRICLVLVLCGGVGCAARGDVAQLRKAAKGFSRDALAAA